MLPRVNKHLPCDGCCSAPPDLLAARSARADDPLPQPAAPKRYDSLAAHSPFAPPTGPAPAPAATPPPPPGPSWSDNLVVTSIMQNGNDYTATVMEKDTSARYLVHPASSARTTRLELATVTWAEKPEAIKVTLRKGNQLGDVHFDSRREHYVWPRAGTAHRGGCRAVRSISTRRPACPAAHRTSPAGNRPTSCAVVR